MEQQYSTFPNSKEWYLEKRKDFSAVVTVVSFLFLLFLFFFSPLTIAVFTAPVVLYLVLTKLPVPNQLFGFLKAKIVAGIVAVVVITITIYFFEFMLDWCNLSLLGWKTFFLRVFSEGVAGFIAGGIAFFFLIIGNYKEIEKIKNKERKK